MGKIDDERFSQMSVAYTDEQKSSDISRFLQSVRRYEYITELTPKIMHEFVDKIIVHERDKSSGHREQEIEINFRFKVLAVTITLDSREYNKKAA